MRNIEIKARVDDLPVLEARAATIADSGPTELLQDDTFFACANGRMKLRVLSDSQGELIFYQRPDNPGPKESFCLIARTSSPDALREVLARGYGLVGRVRKRRTLFLAGRTRIHLDRVEGLGEFLELEVVLSEHEPAAAGTAVARDLLQKLGVSPDHLVAGAYVDLLAHLSSTVKNTDEPGISPRVH